MNIEYYIDGDRVKTERDVTPERLERLRKAWLEQHAVVFLGETYLIKDTDVGADLGIDTLWMCLEGPIVNMKPPGYFSIDDIPPVIYVSYLNP